MVTMTKQPNIIKEKKMSKVYDFVTDKIMDGLENGNVPWHKSWTNQFNVRMPTNLVSKKGYRGINIFLLAFAPFDSPYWVTFKQAKQLGGSVKKGEKSTMVVFWKNYDRKVENASGDEETKKSFVMRYYNVFNTEQCEGLEKALAKVSNEKKIDFNPISECEEIVTNMQNPPTFKKGSGKTYYQPDKDVVCLPDADYFESEEFYYSVTFHELAHSTGHKSRLDRKTLGEGGFFGDENYSKEELVAEMTSAMLCGVAGIENKTIENSAAYIKGWSKKLKSDPKLVVSAAQQAQKAADYILNK